MSETYVVVGAGHSAGQAAASLRQLGFDGGIVLVGEEQYPPYQRPPLSKKFLAGELEAERTFFKPGTFYEGKNVELRLGTRVEAVDTAAKTVALADGEKLSYDKVLLCLGSHVRRIPVPGADLPEVCYVRTIDDVLGIQAKIGTGRKLVIVGGGYIGLEVASVCVKLGMKVTVLEMEDRLMSRVVAPEVSEFYAQYHRANGVAVECGAIVNTFEGKGGLERVTVKDGRSFDADLAVVGIGIAPNCALAEAAGVSCDNGIVVDEYCRTSETNVYAAGDCTSHPNAAVGHRIRLESVHNALEQAKTAAHAMCGDLQAYEQVPWFWSDQYDLKLQIAGLTEGHDRTVCRGDPAAGGFAVFYQRAGALIAVEAVNSPREFMLGRKLIGQSAVIDPERLGDTGIAMSEMV